VAFGLKAMRRQFLDTAETGVHIEKFLTGSAEKVMVMNIASGPLVTVWTSR
jgi:hypothetical protein